MSLAGDGKRLTEDSQHVQRPLQIDLSIMQSCGERCGEQTEEHHAVVTPTDDICISGISVEVLSVYVEAYDRADSNDLSR